MQLYNNMKLKKSMTIKDITGKNELKAVDVFAFCIEYIWNTLFRRIKEQIANLNEENIHWVLTVPAIWNEDARQFMLEAAKKAGIEEERLTLALEPEAAAFCCKSDEIQKRATGQVGRFGSFDTGARFLVVDLGGGTVDITSNEILESGQLKEIHSASGGPWGGNIINTRIWKLLRGIFGDKTVTKFIAEHRDDYLELARKVELKKRTVSSDGKMRLEIPRSLIIEANKSNPDTFAQEYKDKVKLIKNMLIFSPDVVLQIFKDGIDKIIIYVQDLLDQPKTKGVSTILLVGGYASCDLLKDAMKTKFNNLTVICPLDPDLAVLKGAVIIGHMDTPIVGRIAKFHYGIAMVPGIEQSPPLTSTIEKFHTIIRKGQPIQINEVVTGYDFPITFNKEEAFIQIYASDDEEPPKIISSDNCRKIGHIRIKLPKFRREARLKIGISTSETEFKVVARDEHTGKCFEGVCSFLN
ncbi:heat shock 70 kDa protein 12A-like isoform X2 [Mytilus californianus]|uniref:heat shock 70 kDa protein 12A-like isoform X1 n=1 Tax=Mytilus californianus TaxID=6549 RepID=UPI0022451300|nr:heat shock 70 kDa protein 12A-like isoform X1 [Mytilus californianus]XP_052079327.1 heat shock 70 kDa protein 12A-like isoform X2 [Mytilus californianus]